MLDRYIGECMGIKEYTRGYQKCNIGIRKCEILIKDTEWSQKKTILIQHW